MTIDLFQQIIKEFVIKRGDICRFIVDKTRRIHKGLSYDMEAEFRDIHLNTTKDGYSLTIIHVNSDGVDRMYYIDLSMIQAVIPVCGELPDLSNAVYGIEKSLPVGDRE